MFMKFVSDILILYKMRQFWWPTKRHRLRTTGGHLDTYVTKFKETIFSLAKTKHNIQKLSITVEAARFCKWCLKCEFFTSAIFFILISCELLHSINPFEILTKCMALLSFPIFYLLSV